MFLAFVTQAKLNEGATDGHGCTRMGTAIDGDCEEKVIVELKCVDRFDNEHLAQCIYYLKAARLGVALLLNFQRPKVEWKRVLLDR